MEWDQVIELLLKNRGKVAGIALGLTFGWFAITYGMLKAFFVSICIVAGYYIGKGIDSRGSLRGLFFDRFRDR